MFFPESEVVVVPVECRLQSLTWRLFWVLMLLISSALVLPSEDAAGKLEPSLQAMYQAWKSNGNAGLQAEAHRRGIDLHFGRLKVRIIAENAIVLPAVQRDAVRTGAKITSSTGSSLFAEVGVVQLPSLAANLNVIGVYLDRRSQLRKE